MHPDENKIVFLVDAMLGNIARKLRLMGYDSGYFSDVKDNELIKLARTENRIIISRDEELIKKARKEGLKTIFIKNKDEIKQIQEIIDKADIKKIEINGENARCPKCNSKTLPIDKKNIEKQIPFKVFKNNEKFWQCENCKKIFWEGTHIRNLKEFIVNLHGRK